MRDIAAAAAAADDDDVYADDHSRVKLKRSSLDYINASLVAAAEADRSYILTQVITSYMYLTTAAVMRSAQN